MHPNRQFPAHFVVHMPLFLHDLFRVAHPLYAIGGRGNRHLGYVPWQERGYRRAQALTMQGGEGVCATIRGRFTPSLFSIRRRHIFSFLGRFGRHVACHNELRQVKPPPPPPPDPQYGDFCGFFFCQQITPMTLALFPRLCSAAA